MSVRIDPHTFRPASSSSAEFITEFMKNEEKASVQERWVARRKMDQSMLKAAKAEQLWSRYEVDSNRAHFFFSPHFNLKYPTWHTDPRMPHTDEEPLTEDRIRRLVQDYLAQGYMEQRMKVENAQLRKIEDKRRGREEKNDRSPTALEEDQLREQIIECFTPLAHVNAYGLQSIIPGLRHTYDEWYAPVLAPFLEHLPHLAQLRKLSFESTYKTYLTPTQSRKLAYFFHKVQGDYRPVAGEFPETPDQTGVYQWFTCGSTIHLYQRGCTLGYRVVDDTGNSSLFREITSTTRSGDELKKEIVKGLPIQKRDGTLAFSNVYRVQTWNIKNVKIMRLFLECSCAQNKYQIFSEHAEEHELSLVWRPNDRFSWCLFKTNQCFASYNACEHFFPSLSKRCSRETRDALALKIKGIITDKLDVDLCKSVFDDLVISEVKLFPFSELWRFQVYVEPRTEKSHIDPRMSISPFRWAVTVITHKGVEGNHAQLVVEGVNGDPHTGIPQGYFMYLAQFGPPVTAYLLDPEKLRYEERTTMWKRSSDEVLKMMASIEADMDKEIPWSRLGSDSIFSGGADSCITWTRDKLKISGVFLDKSWFGFLVTRTKNYTRPAHEYAGLSKSESCVDYKLI